MQNNELLPCPFCGGEAKIKQSHDLLTGENCIYVQCTECNVKTDELNCDVQFGYMHKIGREFINPLEVSVKTRNTRKLFGRIVEQLETEKITNAEPEATHTFMWNSAIQKAIACVMNGGKELK